MPKGTTKSNNRTEIGSFLRSINVQLDAGDASRVAHFRPTAKAAVLLEKLCLGTSPAILVTAPYGSGKSLTATYALHLIENRDDAKSVLRSLAESITNVSTTLGEYAVKRGRSKARGLTIALQGNVPALRQALCDAFAVGMTRQGSARGVAKKLQDHLAAESSVPDTMQFLLGLASDAGFDQVFLAWDEFGRHLESLISNGRPSELHDVQQLAEVTTRSKGTPLRMCVLLHQGFSAYAATAPDTVRREWQKIEGRFERVEYIDDSKELLRLLVELTEAQHRTQTNVPSARAISAQAKSLLAAGMFKEFKHAELASMLARVFPLDGSALFLLPRISARVAQNERTLFNFLQSADWSARVGADSLYRYFEPAMRQDVGPGGTYRAMLETNSATSKCATEDQVYALQAACALSIGLSSNRTKISRALLALAIAGPTTDITSAEQTIDALIERKLLLYRRHSDEVSVWHGTDANLRERIADTRIAVSGTFDLVEFLAREWPLPAVRATEHNDRFRMRRFFTRSYRPANAVDGEQFAAMLTGGEAHADGKILHFLPAGDGKTTAAAIEAAREMTRSVGGGLMVSVPLEPVPLEQAAVELAAIMMLQKDRALLDADPLVAEELRQMEDDARSHMLRLIERVTTPNEKLRFIANGKELKITGAASLRKAVSANCDRLYSFTPLLPNEQVNRRKPSAVIVNARKKLLAAIFEASGRPEFGFHEAAYQQELGAAVLAQYRAIIRNTGLYRDGGGERWGFAAPKSIKDPGLAAVWQEIRSFFTEASDHPKPFTKLIATLQAPPYGVRAGVIPILLACATRAFPVVGSMTCDGQYVSDIRPTVIEDLCKDPARYALNVVAVEDGQRAYLEGVCELFRGKKVATIDDPDLVRRAFEWIQYWKTESPEAVRVSSTVTPQAAAARKALWATEDPVRVLLQILPTALGVTDGNLAEALVRLAGIKRELDSVVDLYTRQAMAIMVSSIGEASSTAIPGEQLAALKRWADAIPPEALDVVHEPRAKGVVSQLSSPGTDAARLATMISARLTKQLSRWDDTEVAKFQQEFRRIVDVVEAAAFDAASSGTPIDDGAKARLTSLVERRISHHVHMLSQIVGKTEARALLLKAVNRKAGPVGAKQETLFNG